MSGNQTKELPLLSVVLPVYNRVNHIAAALRQILDERKNDYPAIELIVVDGGSTDGTCEAIKPFLPEIQCFISEKDRGVADAINKGIRISKGAVVRYISCDDYLIPGGTRRMMTYLQQSPETAVAGARAHFYSLELDGTKSPVDIMNSLQAGVFTYDEAVSWGDEGIFAPIETWFFRRETLDSVGVFDMRYRIACDFDLGCRITKSGRKMVILPEPILHKLCYQDGSQASSNLGLFWKERFQIVWRDRSNTWLFCRSLGKTISFYASYRLKTYFSPLSGWFANRKAVLLHSISSKYPHVYQSLKRRF